MLLQLFLVLPVVGWARSEDCPAEYQRFSRHHTFCTHPNPNCQIKVRGFVNSTQAIHRILRAYNTIRNKIAMGQELAAGGLPAAANMMKLMWDPQLAEVAQRWAENCKIEHDCNECRAVENFAVGQSIAYMDYACHGGMCDDKHNGRNPNLKGFIQMFYDEIKNFKRRGVWKTPKNGTAIGNFTQMILAETWRVGCGFVAFQNEDNMRHFLVCNYGPMGSDPNKYIYKPGPPCSRCPINACCDKKCGGRGRFEGICRMKNKSVAPEYVNSKEVPSFYCDFKEENKDCKLNIEGPRGTVKKTLMGNLLSFRVKGGKETEIFFEKTVYPSRTPERKFCIWVLFRKGPAIAGEDRSKLQMVLIPEGLHPLSYDMDSSHNNYVTYSLQLPLVTDFKFSLKFSVAKGADEHVLEILRIRSYGGFCSSQDRY